MGLAIKTTAIDQNRGKLAVKIGYWLYRFIRLFKKSKPDPNPQFLAVCGLMTFKIKKHYRNKYGTECVDFDLDGLNLVLGYDQGWLFLRLNNGIQNIDKKMLFKPTNKGIQEIKGVINSMKVSLKDKIERVA